MQIQKFNYKNTMKILDSKNFLLLFTYILTTVCRCPQACLFGCDNSAADTYTCTTCVNGFFVENNRCLPCPAECETCTSRTACTVCKKTSASQTQAHNSGLCIQCAFNCKTCTTTPTNCASCYNAMTLSTVDGQSRCAPPSDVGPKFKCSQTVMLTPGKVQTTTPAATNSNYCIGCIPGFFSWMNQCLKCPSGAAICRLDVNAQFTSLVVQNTFSTSITSFSAGPMETAAKTWLKESWIELALIFRATSASASKMNSLTKSNNFVINDPNTFGQFMSNITSRLTDQEKVLVFNAVPASATTFDLAYVKAAILKEIYKQVSTTQCLPGLALNTDLNPKCVKCAFPSKVNPSTNLCRICEPGFASAGLACQPCHSTCLTCSNYGYANSCTSCVLPAKLFNSECKRCGPECATCDSTATNCATCVRPFSRYPHAGNHSCYRCVEDTCLDCLTTNYSSCLLCAQGYTLNDTVCIKCQPQCTNCLLQASSLVCYLCTTGYTLNNNNCVQCQANCLNCSEINPKVCLKCNNGFTINDTKCVICPAGCLECNGDYCTKWRPGFVAGSDSLVECKAQFCTGCDSDRVCAECQSGYFLDTATKTCRKCGPFCLECNSTTVCTRCVTNSLPGSGATANTCIPCNQSCATCNPANSSQCRSCRPGLYMNGTDCFKCPKYCDSCTSDSACSKCQSGYILNQQGRCTRCAASCNGECSPLNITHCFNCAPGFQLVSNKCVSCGVGCDTCSNRQCTKCKRGFNLISETSGTNSVTRCRPSCVFPCEKCENNVCLQCADGFDLTNSLCIINLQCLPANDAACKCPQRSVKRTIAGPPATYSCVACPNDCQLCTGAQASGVYTTTCTVCLPGFFLSGANCTACPAGCKSCTSATECQDCKDGFVNVDGTSTCVPCQNCSTCIDQPNKCLTCQQGFNLVNDKCIGSFTVGFTLIFSDSFDTFMSSGKLDTVITNMATILNVPEERIIINDTIRGSTHVVGGASADNSTQAGTLVTTLSQALTSDPNALGSNLLASSTIQIQLDGRTYKEPKEEQNQTTPPNIPLIVGLAVGLGGTFIIVMAVLIYLKVTGKICNNQQIVRPVDVSVDEFYQGANSTSLNEITRRKE